MAEHFVANGSVYPYWDNRLERRPSIDTGEIVVFQCRDAEPGDALEVEVVGFEHSGWG